jgi:N-methylhydantoinase B
VERERVDPVTFEILRHRMWQIIHEGRIALIHVSGSPVVYGCYDFGVGLAEADGDAILAGGGIIHQTCSVSDAVKSIIRQYEETTERFVPINDGDQFCVADPYSAGLHLMDVVIVAPVFWEGKRIAWVGAASHQTDTGGIDAGGFCLRAESIYNEGVRTSGIKIVERGEIRHDVFYTIVNMIREPDLVALDMKAKIAACNVMKERLLDVIKSYGIDMFSAFCDQFQEYSEEKARAKLKEIPDGTWRAVQYLDTDWRTENIYKLVCTLTKEADSITFDLTGTSDQAPSSINGTALGTRNCMLSSIFGILFYDVPWNEGLLKVINVKIPEGSVFDCKFPAPSSASMPCGALVVAHGLAHEVISKMLAASEKHRCEACAVWQGGYIGPVIVGTGRDGQSFSNLIMDALAGGGGALPDKDGCNTACYISSPLNIICNVETHELLNPILVLSRRELCDTGGPGRFRGGVALGYTVITHDAPTKEWEVVLIGTNAEARNGLGISGGYPSPTLQATVLRNSNVLELLKYKIPDDAEIKGEKLDNYGASGLFKVREGDLFSCFCGGGGGWGDPIERDPELVVKDIIDGYVSAEMAEECYGVVVEPKTMQVDLDKTEKRRKEIREERLGRK